MMANTKGLADLNTFLLTEFKDDLRGEGVVESAIRLLTMYRGQSQHLKRQLKDLQDVNAREYDLRRIRDAKHQGGKRSLAEIGTDQASRERSGK